MIFGKNICSTEVISSSCIISKVNETRRLSTRCNYKRLSIYTFHIPSFASLDFIHWASSHASSFDSQNIFLLPFLPLHHVYFSILHAAESSKVTTPEMIPLINSFNAFKQENDFSSNEDSAQKVTVHYVLSVVCCLLSAVICFLFVLYVGTRPIDT
jgi:hypothetical protein